LLLPLDLPKHAIEDFRDGLIPDAKLIVINASQRKSPIAKVEANDNTGIDGGINERD
jgi:hypothetical protein